MNHSSAETLDWTTILYVIINLYFVCIFLGHLCVLMFYIAKTNVDLDKFGFYYAIMSFLSFVFYALQFLQVTKDVENEDVCTDWDDLLHLIFLTQFYSFILPFTLQNFIQTSGLKSNGQNEKNDSTDYTKDTLACPLPLPNTYIFNPQIRRAEPESGS